jgi:hypothetical protein
VAGHSADDRGDHRRWSGQRQGPLTRRLEQARDAEPELPRAGPDPEQDEIILRLAEHRTPPNTASSAATTAIGNLKTVTEGAPALAPTLPL